MTSAFNSRIKKAWRRFQTFFGLPTYESRCSKLITVYEAVNAYLMGMG